VEEKEREGEIEKLISGEWCLSVKRLSAECRGASWLRLVVPNVDWPNDKSA